MSWLARYHDAMRHGGEMACASIEKRFGLYGYPPEIVSVGLKAADEGRDVNAEVEAYLSGEELQQ